MSSPVDAMLDNLSCIGNSLAIGNLWKCMKEGDNFTRTQVCQAAKYIIADMIDHDIEDTPFIGNLMRQIYISLDHPLPTLDEESLQLL